MIDERATERAIQDLIDEIPEVKVFYETLKWVSPTIDLSIRDDGYWEKREEIAKKLMADPNVPSVAYPCHGNINTEGRGKVLYFKFHNKEDVVRYLIARSLKPIH